MFVGTAAEVGINSQNALFQVDEVWHGSPIPAWQTVFSQPDGRGIWSDSPSFDQGVTYLVVAKREGGALVSVSCGDTQPYGDEVRALRPLEPSAPTAAERPSDWEPTFGAGPLWPLFAGGAALVVGSFLVNRSLRRHRRQRSAS